MPNLWHAIRGDKDRWRPAHWDGWELFWHAADAYTCPRCGAYVRGNVRYVHEEWHEDTGAKLAMLITAAHQIAEKVGARIAVPDQDDEEGTVYRTEEAGGYVIK